jgi:hypothetical protein
MHQTIDNRPLQFYESQAKPGFFSPSFCLFFPDNSIVCLNSVQVRPLSNYVNFLIQAKIEKLENQNIFWLKDLINDSGPSCQGFIFETNFHHIFSNHMLIWELTLYSLSDQSKFSFSSSILHIFPVGTTYEMIFQDSQYKNSYWRPYYFNHPVFDSILIIKGQIYVIQITTSFKHSSISTIKKQSISNCF